MKKPLLLTLTAAFAFSACSTHKQAAQPEVNDPSVYYALKGEEMIPTASRVSQKNAGQSSIQVLSPTNAPATR